MPQFPGALALSAVIGLVLVTQAADARIGSLSRANCLGFVNKSVTYDRPNLNRFIGTAYSRHVPQGNVFPKHVLAAPNNRQRDWRFYAGDGSDSERITVFGEHTWVELDAAGNPVGQLGSRSTTGTDCNLVEW